MNKGDWRKAGQPDEGHEERIETLLAGLEVEKAPASLTRRLLRIPREEGGRPSPGSWWRIRSAPPTWLLAPALAVVPLLLVAIFLMQRPHYSASEIEQARRDLAVALVYVDKAGLETGNQIQEILGGELRHSVKDPLSKHIPFTAQSLKEEST